MNLRDLSVTIIGAGVAGLAAACALAQRGVLVRVLEQAHELSDIGAGVQISPNGAAVLSGLGLGGALVDHAMPAQAITLRRGRDGVTLLRMDLAAAGFGQGYHFLHRADLIALLAEGARAAGARIETGCRLVAIAQQGTNHRLTFADGAVIDAPVVIGADGLHSSLHARLNPGAAARFTGQVAWRAVIAGNGETKGEAQLFTGPGRHLVSYCLRGGSQRNIVAVEERAAWAEEGWSIRDAPDNLRRAFAGFRGPVPDWLDRVQDLHIWGLHRHLVATRWHEGGLVILGDAAHPTLPFMAQGANMALEDAWVLSACMARHADAPAAFAAFQAARKARVKRIVAAAERNARLYHLRGPARVIAHLGLRFVGQIAPAAPLRRFRWLYGHDVTLTHA